MVAEAFPGREGTAYRNGSQTPVEDRFKLMEVECGQKSARYRQGRLECGQAVVH